MILTLGQCLQYLSVIVEYMCENLHNYYQKVIKCTTFKNPKTRGSKGVTWIQEIMVCLLKFWDLTFDQNICCRERKFSCLNNMFSECINQEIQSKQLWKSNWDHKTSETKDRYVFILSKEVHIHDMQSMLVVVKQHSQWSR